MLKTLDNDGRLTVIDGDTGVPSVQQEFVAIVFQLSQNITEAAENEDRPNGEAPANINGGPRIEDFAPNGKYSSIIFYYKLKKM